MTISKKIAPMIALFIGVVILFSAIAALYPEAADAGDQLNASNQCSKASCFYNDSRTAVCTTVNTTPDDTTACRGSGDVGVPLGSLFAGGGIVFLLLAAVLLYLVLRKAKLK